MLDIFEIVVVLSALDEKDGEIGVCGSKSACNDTARTSTCIKSDNAHWSPARGSYLLQR